MNKANNIRLNSVCEDDFALSKNSEFKTSGAALKIKNALNRNIISSDNINSVDKAREIIANNGNDCLFKVYIEGKLEI